jgi:ABC-type transport system involved in multi-copper enzyme maturation permease subunit
MTTATINLARWEWFKLQRRWMPWILLAILLLFSQLSVWGSFFAYNALQGGGGSVALPTDADGPVRGGQFQTVSCNELLANPSEAVPQGTSPEVIASMEAQCRQQAVRQDTQLQQQYDGFTLPGSLSAALGMAHGIGLVLLAVLTASAIGSDFGLGTLRPILARGTGRHAYLAGKFLVLVAVAAGAMLAVAIVTAISSLIIAGMAQAPPRIIPETTSWADAGVDLVLAWASFIPFIAFAGMVTVLTRSAAAGMAIGLGYYFAEGILIAALSALFDWFGTAAEYLLIRNINALAGGFGPVGLGAGDIGPVQAGLVLAVYTVALVGIAVGIFHRRDVTGPSGG